ncbi:MAG: hypothetical protein Q4P72_01125 [Eubacteriales bacterium]|nr:hypothetical protein [Eubacteriales bacterium]
MTKSRPAPANGGIINVYKPAGMASFHVVHLLKRWLGESKIGFDGTLDPFAEGVLPIYIGRATAVLHYAEAKEKSYLSYLGLGWSTDSLDASGTEVIARCERSSVDRLSRSEIESALECICRRREQRVPVYSAAKHEGQRFVDLLRRGEADKIPERYKTIQVEAFELLADDLDENYSESYPSWPISQALLTAFPTSEYDAGPYAHLLCEGLSRALLIRHVVSRGTYIRQLNSDLAEILSVPASTLRLLRERSGPFHAREAVHLSALEEWSQSRGRFLLENEQYDEILQAPDLVLKNFAMITCRSREVRMLLQGKKLKPGQVAKALSDSSSETALEDFLDASRHEIGPNYLRLYCGDRLIGLLRHEADLIRAERMFVGIESFNAEF